MTETIQAGNKLIAAFMEYETCTDPDHADNKCYQVPYAKGYHRLHQMQHHASWEWLMPVVEKIEALGKGSIQFYIKDRRAYVERDTQASMAFDLPDLPSCYSGFCDTKILAVFSTVVQFITWYNSTTELSKPLKP